VFDSRKRNRREQFNSKLPSNLTGRVERCP
jgi:hypothetical protein